MSINAAAIAEEIKNSITTTTGLIDAVIAKPGEPNAFVVLASATGLQEDPMVYIVGVREARIEVAG